MDCRSVDEGGVELVKCAYVNGCGGVCLATRLARKASLVARGETKSAVGSIYWVHYYINHVLQA